MTAADPTAPRSHTPVPERASYYPDWGPEHSNLNLPVLSGGVPTGFQLGDILFEKRWAVDPASGEILGQEAFERLFKRWNAMACTSSGQIIPIAAVNRNFNPEFESCPEVRKFVLTTIGEEGREVPVGWDAQTESVPTGPRTLFDADGENPMSAAETLLHARVQRAMKELKGLERAKGILPAETYQGQVDDVLQAHGLSVEQLTAGLAAGAGEPGKADVSDEDIARLEKMAADEQAPAPEETKELTPAAAPEAFTAPCGKECKSKAGASAHARNCDDCKATEAPSE